MTAAEHPRLSLVIPCFNEEEVLPALRQRLVETLERLGASWELVFVDDGSRDRTLPILAEMHGQDERVKVVGLSRNFGQQTAISAGLSYASGDAVAILDADLQDPQAGYEVDGTAADRSGSYQALAGWSDAVQRGPGARRHRASGR